MSVNFNRPKNIVKDNLTTPFDFIKKYFPKNNSILFKNISIISDVYFKKEKNTGFIIYNISDKSELFKLCQQYVLNKFYDNIYHELVDKGIIINNEIKILLSKTMLISEDLSYIIMTGNIDNYEKGWIYFSCYIETDDILKREIKKYINDYL